MTFFLFESQKVVAALHKGAKNIFLIYSNSLSKKEIIDGVIRNLIMPRPEFTLFMLVTTKKEEFMCRGNGKSWTLLMVLSFIIVRNRFIRWFKRVHEECILQNEIIVSILCFVSNEMQHRWPYACAGRLCSLWTRKRFIAIKVSESIANLAINREKMCI